MTDFTHSLAILIGIDTYGSGIPRLTTAVNDATRLAELLAAQHGYETLLLTEPAAGEPITLARLRTLFTQELPARLGDDDRLLVYFAGHGVALDGDDGPRGYLVPQDARPGDSASMLAMTDLNAWLASLPCRHMLAILDCCFAGAFRWASTRQLGALPDVIHKERYDRYLASPAWQALTSAAYDQTALDVLAGDAKRGTRAGDDGLHSPFALALFDALAGAGDVVPVNQRDGVITASELFVYLQDVVSREAEEQANHEQMPGLWPLSKHRKGEYIFLVPGHALNLPPAPALNDEANPYRGLKSYDQKHAQLFFGREDEIKELAALVDRQPFVAVLGASGTGKSSLVKAGVLPRLEKSEPVHHVLPPIRPTEQPVQALEACVKDLRGLRDLGGLEGDDALAQVVARWAAEHPGQRLVLTIDQFEELATLCRDDGERARFLRLLANAIEQQPEVLRLIITLRTDFEPQFTQEGSPLAGIWQQGRTVVPPMDIEDLRQVIEGPASVRVLYFDPPELVDDLIKEVIQTPGALPLLSFTLSELYVKYVRSGRDDRALSGADYKALGGVVGSLRNRATEEYDGLPDDAHQATMQRVMLRMVAVEGGGELARRRVALSELAYPTEEENTRVKTVLDRLVDARLLVRGTSENPDGRKGEAYVEPAHDALVLAWDKLLRWKKEAEEYLPLQRRLAQAATEWGKATPEAKSGLLWDDDPRLPQVEETLWPTDGKQNGLRGRACWTRQLLLPLTSAPADTKWLNEAELAFAQDSVQARAQFWRRVLSVATVFALVLIIATTISLGLQSRAVKAEGTAIAEAKRAVKAEGTAVAEATRALNAEATAVVNEQIAKEKQAEAEREARRAKAGELVVNAQNAIVNNQNDPSLALLLAIDAVEVTWRAPEKSVTANAYKALSDAVDTAPRYVMTLPRHRHTAAVRSAAYSPDGTYLVTASADQTARIWDAATGQEVHTLSGHTASVVSAAYSTDGRQIVTASVDKTARIWDAATGQEVRSLSGHTGPVRSAAYSPDGKTIVTASDDQTVRIWDAATGQEMRTLSGHTAYVNSAAYSPDGEQIVTASDDQTARIWDAATGQEVRTLSGHTAPFLSAASGNVYSAAYSPDGKTIVTASYDQTARIWDAATGQEVRTLSGHTDRVHSAAYSPDGKTIVTASDDHTARIWDAATGQEVRTLNGHTGYIYSAAYSSDGTQIVTASDDQTVRIWDAASGQEVPTLSGHTNWVSSAAYSPDGTQIVTASWDQTVRIWDAATRQEVRTLSGHTSPVWSAAYSPDGTQIVTGGCGRTDYFTGACKEGSVRIWDAATGQEVRTLSGHIGAVWSAAYSPDGTQIVTASEDHTARIWDAATGQAVRTLSGHTGPVNSAAYSPDGEQIVTTASYDKTARIWNAATGQAVRTLSGHTDSVNSAAYSSDGKLIVTASHDRTVRIWDAATGQEVRTLSGHSASVNSAAYSPDGKLIVTASYDKTARIWDAATGQVVRTLSGHGCDITNYRCSVNSAAYSPDGTHIVTASDDQTARIWDAGIEDLLGEAGRLIQRDPPLLTPEERRRYGLE